MQIAILAAGNVGGALGKGWARTGHRITDGVPNPAEPKYQSAAAAAGNAGAADTARDAEVIVRAVPFGAVEDVLRAAGDLEGRIILDTTNPLRMNGPALELSMGFGQSGGEYVASLAAGATPGSSARGDDIAARRSRHPSGHDRRCSGSALPHRRTADV